MDDIFRSYIVPAIIAGVVALISVVVTAVAQYKSTKNMTRSENERLMISLEGSKRENSKRLSVEYITNERIRWIQELRKTFADFRSHTTDIAFKRKAGKTLDPNYSFEINREATYLKLLFKSYGKKERIISNLIDKCIECINREDGNVDEYFEEMDKLTKEIQNYLKIEWERVKTEIMGKKWTDDKESNWRKKLDCLNNNS